jgi:hypothetical protein
MFYIRYEYLSESYPRFRVYKSREQEKVLPYVIHESFADVVKQSEMYPKYQHFFMLDESRFAFFRFDVFETREEKFTLADLKNIIDEKTKTTKKQHEVNGERIMAYIDTIYVDGEEKKYVIGEKGEIFFRLYIMYLDKKSINTINSAYGNFFEIKNITFVPQSFHTLLFLRNSLKKDNFVLLYINETFCKAINVRNGFYESVETLNLGLSALKQMYKDNGIVQYRYKEFDVIESNPLAKSLVSDTLQFYSQLFCKRLQEKNFVGNDVIVISPITKNVHFIDIFNAEYKKLTNNYIVPFHHSELLETFDRERDPDDMDALILMNREEYIKRELGLQSVENS